jgi:hypothetical protein
MLRKRTEAEERLLGGVVLELPSLKLGRFTGLSNFIPGKLHKFKKKRGVSDEIASGPGFALQDCPARLVQTLAHSTLISGGTVT